MVKVGASLSVREEGVGREERSDGRDSLSITEAARGGVSIAMTPDTER